MDLPRRFSYGPRARQIIIMFALGAAILAVTEIKSFALSLVLSFLPLAFALMGMVRRLFFPRFLELRADALLLPAGLLQANVRKISYADIEHTSEVKRGRMITMYLRTKERSFEITSILLPDLASYVAVRDFINSRVPPVTKPAPSVEAGKYCFQCNYEGDGEIYNSIGEPVWRFRTLHKRPHYPYGLFKLPDFVVHDNASKELFRIKLKRKWPLPHFEMIENGSLVCTLKQRSLLRNKFTLCFANGQKWTFKEPLFSVSFSGWSEAGEKIQARLWTHNVWYVLIDAKVDNPQLVASLAFIHRERLRFN